MFCHTAHTDLNSSTAPLVFLNYLETCFFGWAKVKPVKSTAFTAASQAITEQPGSLLLCRMPVNKTDARIRNVQNVLRYKIK